MGKYKIRCIVCGSKKVRILRHVYQCSSCNTMWDKRTGIVVDKYKVSASLKW